MRERDSTTSRHLAAKLAAIAIIGLLLLVPLGLIGGLIAERQARLQATELEVGSTWGGAQLLGGPVLSVPFATPQHAAGDGATPCLDVLPERLEIDGTVTPSIRRRGIYEVVVYSAELQLRGTFPRPAEAEALDWRRATVSFGLAELRGLRRSPRLSWRGQPLALDTAAASAAFGQGLSARLPPPPEVGGTPAEGRQEVTGTASEVGGTPVDGTPADEVGGTPAAPASGDPGASLTFTLEVALNGSGSLRLLPLGDQTVVTLHGAWSSPSFQGAFLPDRHSVEDDGFSASWSVPKFARGYPSRWRSDRLDAKRLRAQLEASSFGVDFLQPVDFYRTTERSTKYGVLFIALTFGTVFLLEVLGRQRLHPLQYGLAGMALALFYLLLLALAEHVGFGPAYLVAATATVALLGGYGAAILARRGQPAVLVLALATLYALLYVLVRLETYTLLVGAGALFALLAAAMFATRKIDWYTLGGAHLPPAAPQPSEAPLP